MSHFLTYPHPLLLLPCIAVIFNIAWYTILGRVCYQTNSVESVPKTLHKRAVSSYSKCSPNVDVSC